MNNTCYSQERSGLNDEQSDRDISMDDLYTYPELESSEDVRGDSDKYTDYTCNTIETYAYDYSGDNEIYATLGNKVHCVGITSRFLEFNMTNRPV